MSDAKITTILVTYQSQDAIGRALASLRRSHDRGLLDCVVVDNVSKDRTLDIVRDDHPWARLVESGGNIGYGRACNLGLQSVETPYVMFMNPDATIEPDAVERLIAFLADRPHVGMVAPAIVEGDRYQPAGVLTSPKSILAQAAGIPLASLRQRPINPGEQPFPTDWLCGALLVMRTDLIREMGGFDPKIFLYFDETDLCRRMLRRGLELWAVGEAVAHHEGAASAQQHREGMIGGCIAEHFFRSRYYYLVKHWGTPVAVLTEMTELALLAVRWLGRRIRGRTGADLAARLRRPVMRLPVMPENHR